MANTHLHNISRQRRGSIIKAPHTAGKADYAGPWSKRRVLLAQDIQSRGENGLAINLKWTLKMYGPLQMNKDLCRFIEDGYAMVSHKNSNSRLKSGRKSYRTIHLTEKGLALIPADQTPRVAVPYAKRNAALAEWKELNSPKVNPAKEVVCK